MSNLYESVTSRHRGWVVRITAETPLSVSFLLVKGPADTKRRVRTMRRAAFYALFRPVRVSVAAVPRAE